VPPNVTFEVDDIEEAWRFSSSFDYIHGRYLAGAIKDWPRLMRQAYEYVLSAKFSAISFLLYLFPYRNLNPGGWVEFQDFTMKFYTVHGEFRVGCPLDKWTDEIIDGIKSIGLEPEPGPKLERWVREAGFVNVHHKVLAIPTGMWPRDKKMKEIGAFDLLQLLDGLEAISLRVFTGIRRWEIEELKVFLAVVRKDLTNPKFQAQHNL
jgi:hypothetical protein